VNDGVIVVKEGQKKSEMKVEVKEAWRELLKNPAGSPKPPAAAGVSAVQPAKTGAAATLPSRSPIRATSSRRVRPGAEVTAPPATGAAATASNPAAAQQAKSGAGAQEQRPGLTPTVSATTAVRAPEQEQTPAKNNPATEQSPPAQAGTEGENVAPPPIPTEKDIIHTRLMEEVRASRMTQEEAKQIEENVQTIEQLDEVQRQRAQGK
jgi:hypothetical protein